MPALKRSFQVFKFRRAVYARKLSDAARFAFEVQAQPDFLQLQISRSKEGRVLRLDARCFEAGIQEYAHYLRPVIATFSRIEQAEFTVNVSIQDGRPAGHNSNSCFYFSDMREGVPLLVDPYFIQRRGYQKLLDREPLPWNQRKPQLLWRGATTASGGAITAEDMCAENRELCQRIRLVLLAKRIEHCDLKLWKIVQSSDEALDHSRIQQHDLLGAYQDEQVWRTYQFALDVDGNASSWSQFLKMAKLGCCILKVESPKGFRQWYSHEFTAMQHYLPVRADLSDFEERVDWALSHPEACEAIAMEAYEKARKMTLDSELAKTAALVANRLS